MPLLPPGWKAKWSERQGRFYYQHKARNTSVWKQPAIAPSVLPLPVSVPRAVSGVTVGVVPSPAGGPPRPPLLVGSPLLAGAPLLPLGSGGFGGGYGGFEGIFGGQETEADMASAAMIGAVRRWEPPSELRSESLRRR